MRYVAIVEDDPLFRKELAGVLGFTLDLEVTGIFATGEELLSRIDQLKPEILFLDIGLPGISGIQVADCVRRDYPYMEIVFITADDSRIRDAVRLYASDYITKPLDTGRLRQTIDRIIKKTVVSGPEIELECGERVELLNQQDIYMVEAVLKKTAVYTDEKKVMCQHSLKELESRLDKELFLRTSRSFLVNVRLVEAIKESSRTSYEVMFRGKDYRAYLQKHLYPEFRQRVKNLYKVRCEQ